MGGLSGLHTYFTSRNKTTYEHFRSRYNSQGNPYDLGCLKNWRQVPPSHLRRSAAPSLAPGAARSTLP